jgi:hypothetical protein
MEVGKEGEEEEEGGGEREMGPSMGRKGKKGKRTKVEPFDSKQNKLLSATQQHGDDTAVTSVALNSAKESEGARSVFLVSEARRSGCSSLATYLLSSVELWPPQESQIKNIFGIIVKWL